MLFLVLGDDLVHAQFEDVVDGSQEAVLYGIQLPAEIGHGDAPVLRPAQPVLDVVEIVAPDVDAELHQQR